MRRAANTLRACGRCRDHSNLAAFSTTAGVAESQPFWSRPEHQLQDLENSSADLELARRHNASFPYVKDQVIVGKVVRVARNHVSVFTGHKTLSAFSKKELHLSQLVKSTDFGMRDGPRDVRVGDVMHFVLDELRTPFGDMSLRVNKTPSRERLKIVWEEIVEAYRAQQPIKGRILNSMNRGHAVGVAGFVAFLPQTMVSIVTASKIGVLQDFLVTNVNHEDMNFVVQDYQMVKEKESVRAEWRQRQLDKIARLYRNLRHADTDIREQLAKEASGDKPKGELFWSSNLRRTYISALLDMIAIWRMELRLNLPPQETIMVMDLTAVDTLQSSLSRTQGVTTISKLSELVHALDSTAAHSLMKLIIAKLKSWEIELNPPGSQPELQTDKS